MLAASDAAGGSAAEAIDRSVCACAARSAATAAAAHPASRHGLRHRHAQPHQRHTLCADQVGSATFLLKMVTLNILLVLSI